MGVWKCASPGCKGQHVRTRSEWNSLAPGKFERNFRHVIFKLILVIDGWGISCENALMWMSLNFADDQSTLVQVMAWCRQATSHYLSQCWPRYLSPYSITRPQWVKFNIAVISEKHHGESDHPQLNCLVKSLFRLTRTKIALYYRSKNSVLLVLCEGNPTCDWWIPRTNGQ